MSRLNFRVGDEVCRVDEGPDPAVHKVVRVEPALEQPYFLSDSSWHSEELLTTYVSPDPTWEEVEAYIKRITTELRAVFQLHDESYMYFQITAKGRPDGDMKIEYSLGDTEYSSGNVKGYSLRPTVEEMFRRKKWVKRNIPIVLTYAAGE